MNGHSTVNTANTALVLGASGGIGGEVARQLLRSGWRVRALKRGVEPGLETGLEDSAPAHGRAHAGAIEWIGGDALDPAAVARAAHGCTVIVHAVNPPGYRDWEKLALPMLENSIAAAAAEGALIVLPGTVYNYGPDVFPLIRDGAAQRPLTRKGQVRVRMEQKLRDHAADGGRALIVRAGDFFGPRAGNNWFSQVMVKAGLPVTRITNPARAGVGHQWAYLPDLAATMAALIERRAVLPAFASYHFGGHWDPDGEAMANAIARSVHAHGGAMPKIARFPWWTVPLAAPFVRLMRELTEMRYLWREPIRLDNAALRAVLGNEPHTPLDAAVDATLRGLDCLPTGAEDALLRFGTNS
nr:NADH(P)-binding [uncultured organism]